MGTTLATLPETGYLIDIDWTGVSISREDLLRLCANNPDLRIEKDLRHDLTIMPTTFSKTGLVNTEINRQLANWNHATRLGYVFDSSTGYEPLPETLYSPDVSWVEKKRWDNLTDEQKSSFAPICPDFVIELRSESDRLARLRQKMQDWLRMGARLAWLVDPLEKTITVYEPGTSERVYAFAEPVIASGVVPGFILDLSELNT
jgi:Uma2 family endonuclease